MWKLIPISAAVGLTIALSGLAIAEEAAPSKVLQVRLGSLAWDSRREAAGAVGVPPWRAAVQPLGHLPREIDFRQFPGRSGLHAYEYIRSAGERGDSRPYPSLPLSMTIAA